MRFHADPLVLGIDLGTGSVKAVLVDPAGTIVARSTAPYDLLSPQPGWAETDPTAWWEATIAAVRRATGDQGSRVCGIGLSGQMHGVVLVDEAGRHLRNAILWADGRADQNLAVFCELPQELLAKLGNPLIPGMAGPILVWLRDTEPDVYDSASIALQPKDWLRLQLTGEIGTDPSDASATLLFDVEADDWALDVVAAVGLRPDLLAAISPTTAIAGTLTPEAAGELGLDPGLPVAVGAADTAAAMLGTGIKEGRTAQISIGSGAQIVLPLGAAIVDETRRTNLFRSAHPTGWYAMAAMQNAGIALERVRQWLAVSWDEAYALALSSSPGANGATFVPYLSGERTPFFDSRLRGGWTNLALSNSRADVMRAAFEGVAFGIRLGLDTLLAAGHEIETAILTGGGAVRSEWQQILADILGIQISLAPVSDASARGAAILGAIAAGWPPIRSSSPITGDDGICEPASATAYAAPYERFLAAIPQHE